METLHYCQQPINCILGQNIYANAFVLVGFDQMSCSVFVSWFAHPALQCMLESGRLHIMANLKCYDVWTEMNAETSVIAMK